MSSKSKNHEKGGEPKSKLKKIVSHGIKLELDPEVLDDVEVMDMLDDIQDGNGLKFPKLLKRVFGNQYKDVLDGLRNESGRVTAEKAGKFLGDVLEKLNPNS